MNHMRANELDATAALEAIGAGRLSHEQWVRACLDRIAARDGEVQAFTALDADGALAQARGLDRSPGSAGPLAGLPFAAKDIMDSADLPTRYGSAIYEHHRPVADAAAIALAKDAGGILLGKTATCEFATLTPCATRNPLDLARTPGGSSSGSAAAVADHMVPLAFGTQTSASVIRPAAYCGVVGYKPSFSLFPTPGLKHASPLLDTIGVFARSVRDIALFTLGQRQPETPAAPALALMRSSQWALLEPPMLEAMTQFIKALESKGARIVEDQLTDRMESALALQERLSAVELHGSLAHERRHHLDLLSDRLRQRIGQAGPHDPGERLRLLREAFELRLHIDTLFGSADVLIYPAATGEAPVGLETGLPAFGRLWTLLYTPSICIPIGRGPSGLPLGIQLIARPYDDARLLEAAAFAHRHAGMAS